jgi:hypothetical protein
MVDPWLAGELRLAQRQGLLTGRHLSMVQAHAVIIMEWVETLRDTKRAVEADFLRVKAALIASGDERFRPEKLFKDYFPDDPDVIDMPDSLDVETEEGKLGVDYSEVEWKSGAEAQEEYQELMRQIGGLTSGSVSGADFRPLADGGWK